MARAALHLLGGPTIFDADGAPISGGPAQRHRIALLAQLVIAAPNGVSRERLIGVLWPDRDAAAARRLLNVSLAVLRQTFGQDIIITAGDDLRLGANVIDTDVQQFERSIDDGRLEEAVELCRGPFLEGFFLDDAEEFERWVETHRLRLARRYTDALTVLAERATKSGNLGSAGAWWRALSHAEPSNPNFILQLFDVLEASGDVVSALSIGEAHAAYMRGELGVEPDPRVIERADRLRRSLTETRRDVALPRVVPVKTPRAIEPFRQPPRRPKRVVFFAASVVAILAAGIAATRLARATTIPSPALLATAILPISNASGLPANVASDVETLLALNLEQIEGLSIVRPDTAHASAVQRGIVGARQAATFLGASVVVDGRLESDNGRVTGRFVIRDSAGSILGSSAVTVPRDDKLIPTLVDAASIELARVLWGKRWSVPEPRVASVTTTSLPALKAFLEGEGQFRRLRYDSAAMSLQSAIDLDSTFAMAYFRLGEVNAWRNSAPILPLMDHAERFAARLPQREAAVLDVWRLHEGNRFAAWQAATDLAARYPNDPDVRMAVADILYHSRDLQGASLDSQYYLWDRAITADPASLRPLEHVTELSLGDDTPDHFDRYLELRVARSPASGASRYPLLRVVRWGPLQAAKDTIIALARRPAALKNGDFSTARDVLARRCLMGLEDCGSTLLWMIEFSERIFQARIGMWQWDSRLRRANSAGVGRMAAARDFFVADSWRSNVQDVVSLAAFGCLTPDIAVIVRRKMDALNERSWQAWFGRAELAVATRDTARARAALDSAARLVRDTTGDAGLNNHESRRALNRALAGWIDAIAGDTARAIAEMNSGFEAAGYSGNALWYTGPLGDELRMLMASQPDTRLNGINRMRTTLSTVGVYWPMVRFQLARGLDQRGDTAEAVDQYKRFARLWRDADVPLQHFGDEAAKRANELSLGRRASP